MSGSETLSGTRLDIYLSLAVPLSPIPMHVLSPLCLYGHGIIYSYISISLSLSLSPRCVPPGNRAFALFFQMSHRFSELLLHQGIEEDGTRGVN